MASIELDMIRALRAVDTDNILFDALDGEIRYMVDMCERTIKVDKLGASYMYHLHEGHDRWYTRPQDLIKKVIEIQAGVVCDQLTVARSFH